MVLGQEKEERRKCRPALRLRQDWRGDRICGFTLTMTEVMSSLGFVAGEAPGLAGGKGCATSVSKQSSSRRACLFAFL